MDMSFETIKTSAEEGIFTITISRAEKMNALNQQVLREIKEAAQQGVDNDAVYGIILTGEGTKAFAAGADIAEFADYSSEEAKRMSEAGHGTMDYLENSKKPVIAAVNGFALGGGCELAMACHMRIASENAKFGLPEVGLGVIPGYGGTQRLINLAGKGRALEMIVTGEMVSAADAYRMGLVNHVCPREELLSLAKSILKKTATKGPLAIAYAIEAANSYSPGSSTGYEKEIENFSRSFATDDFKEGTQAFLNKRHAKFQGK